MCSFRFTEADFTALGIDGNDDLIIHGSVDDDQSEVSSDCVLSAAGDITVDLDACGAVASVSFCLATFCLIAARRWIITRFYLPNFSRIQLRRPQLQGRKSSVLR